MPATMPASCSALLLVFGLLAVGHQVEAAAVPPASGPECPGTGLGYACREGSPGFNWQPPSSAPAPDPLLSVRSTTLLEHVPQRNINAAPTNRPSLFLSQGNATALWLRGAAGCASWYDQVEDFMLMRLMQVDTA